MINLKNRSVNILIVEDNPIDILIINTLLKPHFNLAIVTNGDDALKILDEHKFDIILMDINLGASSLNGIDLVTIIKKSDKHLNTKIFAVTAYADDNELTSLNGFDAIYMKPVLKEEIFEFISKHTDLDILV